MDINNEFDVAAFETRHMLREYELRLNGVAGDPDTIRYSEVRERSDLDWYTHPIKTYGVDTEVFRARFLTNLIEMFAGNIDVLTEKVYLSMNLYPKNGKVKMSSMISTLDMVEHSIIAFAEKFMNGNDWTHEMLEMLNYSWMLRLNDNKIAVMRSESLPYISELKSGAIHARKEKPQMDESVIIDHIFRTAIILCNGKPYDKVPRGPVYEDFQNKIPGKDSYEREISVLGQILRKLRIESKRNELSIMYEWNFLGAFPQCNFYFDNMAKNNWLFEGCMALYFVRFVLNNAYVSEYIDAMLGVRKKKWWE